MYTLLSAVLHVAMAILTTWHILLTKKRVRSSISWIAIAWLSPFIGSILYFSFGVNRVARKASRMAREQILDRAIPEEFQAKRFAKSKASHAIAEVSNKLSNSPVLYGNSIGILENGDEAYPVMLEAIRNAKRSIGLLSYIFKLDPTGEEFVEALAEAQERGVEVRVLVDAIGGGILITPAVRRLTRAGIRASTFLSGWPPWQMSLINLRNHKKLLVIDDEIGFVGGLNLSDKNRKRKRGRREIQDTHFKVTGPVVAQLTATFFEDWYFATDERLDHETWLAKPKRKGKAAARCLNSGPDTDLGNIESVFATALASAKSEIRIVTPYFLPDTDLEFLVDLAALKGVKVVIVVPEKTDFRIMDWAMRAQFAHMDIDTIECFQTKGVFDHSKLITVDNVWAGVGSANWDVRSLRLNFEIMLEIFDETTVGRIDKLIDSKLENAKRLKSADLEERSKLIKLRDACARLALPYV